MVERLGEMRNGRRERIEKKSREKRKERNKGELTRQFAEEGLKDQFNLIVSRIWQV